MTLEQLAKEIRAMVAAEIDAPENEEERDDLHVIVHQFSDQAVIDWWTHCTECRGPLLPQETIASLISAAGTQDQFDALVECMAEFEHVDHTPCPTAYAHFDWRHPRA